MLVHEDYVNATKNYRCGDSGLYEPYTDNISKLFKDFQREYGRCISKIYIDVENNKVLPIGWVFQKRQKYDDCNEYYLQEVWITLHNDQPTRTTKYHYHYMKG